MSGTWFFGAQHVWRTQDNGGSQAYLDQHCNLFVGDFAVQCGDWEPIGQDLSSASFGTDKTPGPNGYVVAINRAASDTGTLWAATRRGRVFVASNADNGSAAAVNFYRIDTSSQPERFVSGIDVDPANPNHAFVMYSGYNVYATAAGTATGHVFEVTYDPTTHAATWSGDLASNLGDQPITGIAVDWQTKATYVSTDFGVFARRSGKTNWQKGGNGLPPVAVYGLSMDVGHRVLRGDARPQCLDVESAVKVGFGTLGRDRLNSIPPIFFVVVSMSPKYVALALGIFLLAFSASLNAAEQGFLEGI